MATERRPDVILSDFMMPVMDGPGLLAALAGDSGLRDVPVILMSSLPESSVAERCSGYAAFVRKPFNIFELINLIARYPLLPSA